MGITIHVAGIKPPGERWKQMKDIYDACRKADVPIPLEVESFFNDAPPDPSGVVEELSHSPCVTRWNGNCEAGLEINLKELSPDITILRVYNAW